MAALTGDYPSTFYDYQKGVKKEVATTTHWFKSCPKKEVATQIIVFKNGHYPKQIFLGNETFIGASRRRKTYRPRGG